MASTTIKSWIIISLCFLYASRTVICEPKEDCSPIDIEDVLAAAECSEIIYERGGKELGKGSKISEDSKYKIIEEFDWKKEPSKRSKMKLKGEYLKAVIAQNDEESPTTMFCFMGTKSCEQLDKQKKNKLDAICANATSGKEIPNVWFCDYQKDDYTRPVSIFEYDWVTYQRFAEFVNTKFVPLVKAGGKYVITGHSLGGALSDILAMVMTSVQSGELWKNKHSSLITFGQPATGKGNFAIALDELIPQLEQKLRFVYRKDSVPRLPFSPFNHHSREIYITDELEGEGDEFVVCEPYDKDLGTLKTCAQKYDYWACVKADPKTADHSMSNYLKAVQTLVNGPGEKLEQFMKDQCEAGDSPNLTKLKALRVVQKKKEDEEKRKKEEEEEEEEKRENGNPRKSKKKRRKSKKNTSSRKSQ